MPKDTVPSGMITRRQQMASTNANTTSQADGAKGETPTTENFSSATNTLNTKDQLAFADSQFSGSKDSAMPSETNGETQLTDTAVSELLVDSDKLGEEFKKMTETLAHRFDNAMSNITDRYDKILERFQYCLKDTNEYMEDMDKRLTDNTTQIKEIKGEVTHLVKNMEAWFITQSNTQNLLPPPQQQTLGKTQNIKKLHPISQSHLPQPINPPTILSRIGKAAEVPYYNGRNISPFAFIEEAELYFQIGDFIDDEQKLQAFNYMVGNKASLWYRNIKHNIHTWEELKQLFLKQFDRLQERERRAAIWENIVVDKYTDIEEFVLEGTYSLPKLYPRDSFPDTAMRIIKKLPRDMKEYFLRSDGHFYEKEEVFLHHISTLVTTKDICDQVEMRTHSQQRYSNTYRNYSQQNSPANGLFQQNQTPPNGNNAPLTQRNTGNGNGTIRNSQPQSSQQRRIIPPRQPRPVNAITTTIPQPTTQNLVPSSQHQQVFNRVVYRQTAQDETYEAEQEGEQRQENS